MINLRPLIERFQSTLAEVQAEVSNLKSAFDSLKESDRRQHQILIALLAAVLGLNNPLTKSLLTEQQSPETVHTYVEDQGLLDDCQITNAPNPEP